jgi:very-short-patch-repair endonuclease
MSEPETQVTKGKSLLSFLRDFAKLRRLRVPSYRANDDILWFASLPRGRNECLSPFLEAIQGESVESSSFWLEVRKQRMPVRPELPQIIDGWISLEALDDPRQEPELSPQITILVERTVTDPEAPEADGVTEKVPEVQNLKDHPEVEESWLEYLLNSWIPWSEEMQRWLAVHSVYEKVDFMRRRLEEAEERYELLIAVGLLHWRDSTGASIQRHLLTGAAEFEFDASRGVLTVVPAASFEQFKIELDMLELVDQPRVEGSAMDERLEDLDVCGWDTGRVGEILREIGNRARGNAQVNENEFEKPTQPPDQVFHISFAPALVLRERRSTAFDDLINHLLEKVEQEPSTTTVPWSRFLAEGVTAAHTSDTIDAMFPVEGSGRLYFPLPTNEEQRQIIHKLNASSSVVVKGPPGTGKSHTIANLMCHLLASGERILVTAHAPKALTVLREMLPEEMRDLCVTALGSTRDDQTLLENGVHGILRRQNDWKGTDWSQARLDDLEKQLEELERELAKTNELLRQSREAETYNHQLQGGYEGTAAAIARQLERDNETYCWFPDILRDQPAFPLNATEVQRLSQTHRELTANVAQELNQDIGSFSLPTPDEFQTVLDSLTKAEEAIESHLGGGSSEVANFRFSSEADLNQSLTSLQKLEYRSAHSSFVIGEDLAIEVLRSVLADHQEQWRRVHKRLQQLLDEADSLVNNLNNSHVRLPQEDIEKLLFDAERRFDHLEGGGRRGVWPFIPRVIRETSYLEKTCAVNGHVARELPDLRTLRDYIRLSSLLNEFQNTWPRPVNFVSGRETEAAQIVGDLVTEFGNVLGVFRDCGDGPLPCVPSAQRAKLSEAGERKRWSDAISGELARRNAQSYQARLAEYKEAIRPVLSHGSPHPCLQRMSEAVTQRDLAGWVDAWNERERVRVKLNEFSQYNDLLDNLFEYSPNLVAAIRAGEGNPEWIDRFRSLQAAWYWSCARGWLQDISDRDRHDTLVSTSHRLRGKLETKIAEVAAESSWSFFFQRLDDETSQSLKAWTKAVNRIGRGTGKYAFRHRRTARQYLMSCVPKIPSWIMPLHKLWDSVSAQPGLFDTVIIDEASQSGIDSLVLLLLARRVIVVGDDKQNSPEAVGIREDDIARLAREHLREFRFREEFRPDSSLFDHSERAFGDVISLREHFRCVPEIIRFSNELCYSDCPLIPLRQAPPDRLSPLMAVHIEGASCEGEGQRIRNKLEAETLVEQILVCLEDEAYENKTMGVIVLQGHGQVELIERMLAEKLEPKLIQDRRLRCGVPATFQGDQRDVMFLSLVTAPNVRFRALNRLPEVRRFNVAMSRARDQVWLFHSVQQSDLGPDDLRRRLVRFIRNPLQDTLVNLDDERDRLEREARRVPRRHGDQPEPYESWFEVDVALELLRRKYLIHPQYEVAGKRIDLVVEGNESRLAVECDGDTWHGPEQYEHDAMRQRQLERAQWTFTRVRESDFYANRAHAIETVIEACEELSIHPADFIEETLSDESDRAIHIDESEPAISATNMRGIRPPQTSELLSTLREPAIVDSTEASFPDPRDAPPANLRKALLKIVETEGPLTKAFIYRLYVEGCPHVQRVSKSVRQTLNRVLWSMVKSGEILSEDELGDRSLESQVLRLPHAPRVLQRPAGKRDLLDIPASELCMHIERLNLTFENRGLDDQLAMRRILEFYGFTRLTSVRKKYLSKVIDLHRLKNQPTSVHEASLWNDTNPLT